MTSQKLNSRNYDVGLHMQREQNEKCVLAKNQSFGANWRGDISNVMF